MHRFYLPPEQAHGQVLSLEGDEAHHAHHVLRLEPGQIVEALNGAGEIATCEVSSSARSLLHLRVLARKTFLPPPCPVTLIQSLPKGKLFEDIVEKATELGVSRIVPLISDRVISRPEGEDALRKTAKWKRTAIETLKQCGSAWLPAISTPISLGDYQAQAEKVDFPLLASLQSNARELRDCLARFHEAHHRAPQSASLWIGPEGDFSPAEIERILRETEASPITLGPWVLRTETATIAGLAILKHELRNSSSVASRGA